MTDAISATSANAAADQLYGAAATTTTANKNEIDKDMFLKLMVTQLKYQDPLNPAKADEFLAQTAQFTALEKLTQLADSSTQTALATKMSTASSMVGKNVTYAGDGGVDTTAMVQTASISDSGDIVLELGNGGTVNLGAVKAITQKSATP
jgi:flagellar basal-body rod modification protein FlgD